MYFGDNMKPIKQSLESQSALPPTPYGSQWGRKIADFVILAFIFFIIAFRGFECFGR